MMTKVKVTCKFANFQPIFNLAWNCPWKVFLLGELYFLVENFLSERVIYLQVQVRVKKK